MTRTFSGKTGILFLAAVLLMCSPAYSISKKKKAAQEAAAKEAAEKAAAEAALAAAASAAAEENSVPEPIKLPAGKNSRTYFYKIDSAIMAGVENGSPDTIRSAMASLRQSKGSELDEVGKVLAAVSADIMKLVWPSEKITWDIPASPADTPYTGALNSVKQGIFDSSTGNVDFLTILLPALVILNNAADSSVYDSCENAAKAALSLRSDSVLANYILSCVYEKKQNYQAAEKYLEAAYNASPKTEELSLAYARVLRGNGKLSQASLVLDGIESGLNDISVLKQNAYIAFDSKNYDAAELYVAKVLQQTPNDLEFLLFRAKILVEKNDYIHAVSLLDVYARQDSTSIDYLVLRARVQLDWSKNTAAATETVEKALQLYPDNVDALMFAARISSETDSPVAGKYADELAAKVLEKKPGNQEAMIYALDGLIQRENWQEAYTASRSLVNSGNVSPAVVEKYVNVCIKLGKNNEAYEYAKARYDANPSDETLLQTYILAYSKVGNRDAVIKYIDSLLNSSSAKVKSYLYYRRSFLQLTEEKTLADLRSSLIANPRNSDALFRLYELYYAKADYRKAQYYLKQVVAINPNDTSIKKLNDALTKLIN